MLTDAPVHSSEVVKMYTAQRPSLLKLEFSGSDPGFSIQKKLQQMIMRLRQQYLFLGSDAARFHSVSAYGLGDLTGSTMWLCWLHNCSVACCLSQCIFRLMLRYAVDVAAYQALEALHMVTWRCIRCSRCRHVLLCNILLCWLCALPLQCRDSLGSW